MDIGTVVDLDIIDLGSSGEGIGSVNNFKVFVEGALPLEKVRVSIKEKKINYAVGTLLEIITPSPHRVIPPCPVFGKCGGCQLMNLSYDQQLEFKRKRVGDAFARIAKLPLKDKPFIEPSTPCFGYRNKIQLPVTQKDNKLQIGLYEKGSHQIVPIEHCLIHSPFGDAIYQEVMQHLVNSSIEAYDEVTGKGELRHVLIRSSIFLKQALIVLITTSSPSQLIKTIGQELAKIEGVKGVVHHKNARKDNVILDQNFTLLAGQHFIEETLCGLMFRISAASFFQVNPYQAEKLYEEALKLAEISPESRVLDAYCGIGTLSLLIAKKAKKVVGIECVPQAIQDAKENAKRNQITSAEFLCGQSEKIIGSCGPMDVVFLNPPRKGCDPRVLLEMKRLQPRVIIYISCDPATLARDAALLDSYGFERKEVKAFDLFPQTTHVETLVKFARRDL
jgi:23S rRNA (uracil1939-C5)-methyltransferase